tara:strand:- start:30596 stop:31165 length:570 start_codon:yes stop_codon:yes gene_type:complete
LKTKKSIYNFANFLSISRIVVSIPLIICFENFDVDIKYYYYSIGIILFIILSDVLDGYFARLSNCVTDFGKIIDPIADKTCFMVVLIYLIDKYSVVNHIFNPFLIFYIILVIRDTILLLLSLYNITQKKYVSQANTSGKIFIFFSSIMIIFYVYDINNLIAQLFYILALFSMILSTMFYIKEHNMVRKK